jgi:outer membrane immunogenic protein
MRKLLLAGAAMSAFSFHAVAADLPMRSPAPAPMMLALDWTGFYVGLHGGYGWSNDRWTAVASGSLFTDRLPGTVFNAGQDGWLGGAQIGYNWQMSSFVLGVEASGSLADIKGRALSLADDIYNTKHRSILSGAVRGGFTMGGALLYAKVGYAGVETKRSTVDVTPFAVGVNASSTWHTGLLLGAGVEYAFNNNWSAALEYNYYDLNSKRVVYASGDVDSYKPRLETVTLRLNYRFGAPARPIIARY